jgi:hypothetical protein
MREKRIMSTSLSRSRDSKTASKKARKLREPGWTPEQNTAVILGLRTIRGQSIQKKMTANEAANLQRLEVLKVNSTC